MSFTTSDLIVETLERAGVRRVYGLTSPSPLATRSSTCSTT